MLDFSLAQIVKNFGKLLDVSKNERKYRVRSNTYHHDLAPNSDTIGIWGTQQYHIKTNSLGFKDKTTRQVPLKSESRRTLFIGDSFIEGIGIGYENTFVGIIADKFSKKGIEALNAGVSSYSPIIYYKKIKHLIEDVGLDFDEVIVFIDISDIKDEASCYDFDEHGNVISITLSPSDSFISNDKNLNSSEHLENVLNNNSVLIRFFLMIKRRFFDPEPEWEVCRNIDVERAMWTINDDIYHEYAEKGLAKSKQNMDKLLDFLQSYNKRLTIAVYPWPDQILYHDLNSKQVEFWRSWAEGNKIKFINFFPYFITEEDAKSVINKYYLKCDVHWNEEGHRFIAEAFFKEYGKTN